MEILKEGSFDFRDSYGVIYQKGNLQKIITVNDMLEEDLGDVTNGGTLEIRTCDFELSFEKLFFSEGRLEGHEDEYEFRGRGNMTDVEANLRDFAREFQFAFEGNPKLRQYLSSVFAELKEYMGV